MSCDALSNTLSGYLDGELDEQTAGLVEAHLRQCVGCSTRLERERRLRGAVQAHLTPLRAPERLREAVRTRLRAEVRRTERARSWLPAWAAIAAALLVGLGGGWGLATWRPAGGLESGVTEEIVASHVRSLQGTHLTDIASSEHHTVKPWFAGRLDFSPPVPDFSAQGFPLAGGRLDYLGDRAVAALVYHRRQHVINLLVWPSRGQDAAPRPASRRGYQMVHGAAAGMEYWAISDLNGVELGQFGQLVAADLAGAPGGP